jgi:hypothetical protein
MVDFRIGSLSNTDFAGMKQLQTVQAPLVSSAKNRIRWFIAFLTILSYLELAFQPLLFIQAERYPDEWNSGSAR